MRDFIKRFFEIKIYNINIFVDIDIDIAFMAEVNLFRHSNNCNSTDLPLIKPN